MSLEQKALPTYTVIWNSFLCNAGYKLTGYTSSPNLREPRFIKEVLHSFTQKAPEFVAKLAKSSL
jgi:hypothetical protein